MDPPEKDGQLLLLLPILGLKPVAAKEELPGQGVSCPSGRGQTMQGRVGQTGLSEGGKLRHTSPSYP